MKIASKHLVADRMMADHARLEDLFTRLLDAFNASAREDTQQLWTELETGVERHFRAEEVLLFPRFREFDAREAEALEQEHVGIRRQLAELGVGVDLKLVRAEVAQAFINALRAHAKREDAALYRWADSELPFDAHRHVVNEVKAPEMRAH